MPGPGCGERLAALGAMHPLDQAERFERFEGSIHAYEPQPTIPPAGRVIYLKWGDGALACRHSLHNRAACRGQPLPARLELREPPLRGTDLIDTGNHFHLFYQKEKLMRVERWLG